MTSSDIPHLVDLLADCRRRAEPLDSHIAAVLSFAGEQAAGTEERVSRGGGCNSLITYICDALTRARQGGLPQDLLADIARAHELATALARRLGVL
ncbi:hypothetical protein ABH931_007469 [Streptacidiphilus sp. MAP12-33]|uniref:hypothetical protein n=1 Tax=Streptacidiphilus sp. MAP12-33 TaxID=3156266 RepID=UPI00351185EB